MIPHDIKRRGAMVVYGWLLYHGRAAIAIGEDRYTARCIAEYGHNGSRWPVSDSEPLIRLGRRMLALSHRISPLLVLHGHRYYPWPGAPIERLIWNPDRWQRREDFWARMQNAQPTTFA